MKELEHSSTIGPLPNHKVGWNRPQLLEIQHAYTEGDWPARKKIIEEHIAAAKHMLSDRIVAAGDSVLGHQGFLSVLRCATSGSA